MPLAAGTSARPAPKQPPPQPCAQNAPVLPSLPNLPVPASPLPSSSSTIPRQSRHALAQVHTLDRPACKKSGYQTTPNNDFFLTNSSRRVLYPLGNIIACSRSASILLALLLF